MNSIVNNTICWRISICYVHFLVQVTAWCHSSRAKLGFCNIFLQAVNTNRVNAEQLYNFLAHHFC